ncbi:MAG: M20/M25/M40 family metallo-hydrolase, partial [bacterium]
YRSETAGVGHKCGHDGHSACLAGLALEIDRSAADRDVYFIFQHAEEIGAGARECAEALKANHIDEIYAFHVFPGLPTGTVALKTGLVHFASKGLSMHFEGKQSHASLPEQGLNPAFAIARLIEPLENIGDIAARLELHGTVLCTIIQVEIGEKAFGTSAGSGLLRLTLRAQYEAELERLQQDIEEKARQEAARYSLHYRSEESDVFPETVNHDKSIRKVAAACDQLGIPVRHLPDAFRGSEDFGYYLKDRKGCIFFIGSGEESPGLHTTGFDFPDEIIEPAVEIFKTLI